MRILVLSSEAWNDKINGNNVTSNWFEGMDAEFANIYGSPGEPFNQCCSRYFQITDSMMVKSIVTARKAGKRVEMHTAAEDGNNGESAEEEPKALYIFLKSISGSFLRLVRECIWLWGRYDKAAMKAFIDDFQPDIIFSERMASVKMLRLEKTVCGLCDAPMVAFTGDDEYSLRQLSISPFFWINRFMVRQRLREIVKRYKIYYTLSLEQKLDYENRFGCRMKILQKCGTSPEQFEEKNVNHPIRLIYAGKLYCNRWKALADVVECLAQINHDGIKGTLEIYTGDTLTEKQNRLLNDGKNARVMGRVSQEQLKAVYRSADVALHVESRDPVNRLAVRLSFSTKIIDCIFSSCAVLAYCWKEQSGWQYLKREDAAVCVSDRDKLYEAMEKLCGDPAFVQEYMEKAYECGKRNHERKTVQQQLLADFMEISGVVK